MNVLDIKIQAQLHHGMEINLQYALRFINEAINMLCIRHESACIVDTITISAEKDKVYELPNNLISIKELKLNGRNYSDYRLLGNKIKFSHSGSYELVIHKIGKSITSETETPELNVAYHYALSLFIASREKSRVFGDEDSESQRLMAEFYSLSNDVNVALSTRKKTPRVMKSPMWG